MWWTISLIVFLALIVLCIVNRWVQGTFVGRSMLYLDIFACAVFTGNADMTISARCGLYLRHDPPPQWLALGWCLNHIQKDHTTLAIADDLTRARQAIVMFTAAAAAFDRAGVARALRKF